MSGNTVVIKFGGAAMQDQAAAKNLFEDIRSLQSEGFRIVLLHGGGPEIDTMLTRLGITPRKINGRRVTDANTLQVVRMVLAGEVNKNLVTLATESKIPCVGISGIDGQTFIARKINIPGEDLGFVGEVARVNTSAILALLSANFLPIVCSIATTESNEHLNVNADDAAAALAVALKSDSFVLMTDVPGIMEKFPDTSTIITRIEKAKAVAAIESGAVSKGMIPKVQACLHALNHGVNRTLICDGRNSIIRNFAEQKALSAGTIIS